MALTDHRIGVRELKNRATEIIRDVHETEAEYVVTLRGEPVATLRPYRSGKDERALHAETAESLTRLDALAREVAQAWRSPASALDLLEQQRR